MTKKTGTSVITFHHYKRVVAYSILDFLHPFIVENPSSHGNHGTEGFVLVATERDTYVITAKQRTSLQQEQNEGQGVADCVSYDTTSDAAYTHMITRHYIASACVGSNCVAHLF